MIDLLRMALVAVGVLFALATVVLVLGAQEHARRQTERARGEETRRRQLLEEKGWRQAKRQAREDAAQRAREEEAERERMNRLLAKAEANRRRQEAAKREAAERAAKKAEAKRVATLDRQAKGVLLAYGPDCRRHLEDETYLTAYARKHREELLAQQWEIVKDYVLFQADSELLERLPPHVIERRCWKMRAFSIAERLDAEERQPEKQPRRLTPEEFRERNLRQRAVKALDAIALARAKKAAQREAEEQLAAEGVDDVELQQVCQAIADTYDEKSDHGPTNGKKI